MNKSPTSRERSRKRYRTSLDTQDSQIGLGLSDNPEHTPPATTNSRISAGRIEDAQHVYNLKIIIPQHTEDSFRKQARDQRSTVIPTHRLLARGRGIFCLVFICTCYFHRLINIYPSKYILCFLSHVTSHSRASKALW